MVGNDMLPPMAIWRFTASSMHRVDINFHQCDHCSAGPVTTEMTGLIFVLFTARRCAKRGICRRRVSVSVCVCLSVTLRYGIKTAKRRITQITPHDRDSSLLTPKFTAKFERHHPPPYGGDKCRWGGLKFVFRQKTRYNSKTVQDRSIVSIKVE